MVSTPFEFAARCTKTMPLCLLIFIFLHCTHVSLHRSICILRCIWTLATMHPCTLASWNLCTFVRLHFGIYTCYYICSISASSSRVRHSDKSELFLPTATVATIHDTTSFKVGTHKIGYGCHLFQLWRCQAWIFHHERLVSIF